MSSAMKASIISPEDASLLLHRFVTERIRVLAWFVSADGSVKAKISGFVTSFTRNIGMVLSSEHPFFTPNTTFPATIAFADKAIAECTFRYSDDAETHEESFLGSGLLSLSRTATNWQSQKSAHQNKPLVSSVL
jgi:hypothetical protein